jgi:hypothetical protein
MKNHIWRSACAALLGATLVANAATPVTATVRKSATQAPRAPALAANKILVVTNNTAGAPFGDYLVEILRAEGLNTIDVMALSAVTATDLTDHAVTVLAETALTAPQAALFTTYVNGGGRLLAMKPDPQIKGLFNLGAAAAPVSNGYVRVNAGGILDGFAAGIGFPDTPLQIHGVTDAYPISNPAQATAVATLYSNGDTATSFPAVVLSNMGTGKAAAFLYDLARNVAYTRQGNPANADQNIEANFWNPPTNTFPIFNVSDLFQTAGTTETLWIDRERMSIPQADVQQRLFARLVRYLASAQVPLPQFWYFPKSERSMVVLTMNNSNGSTKGILDLATMAEKYGGTASVFMAYYSGNLPTITATQLVSRGHEIGILPTQYFDDLVTPGLDITTLEDGYTKLRQWYADPNGYQSISPTVAVRSYDFSWKGWSGGAEVAAANGIKMDMNYSNVGRWLRKPDGTWPRGYLNGSGLPMRFVKADGTIVPVFQQLTQLADIQLLDIINEYGYERLSVGAAVDVCKQTIDASLSKDYGAVTLDLQNVYFYQEVQSWLDQCLAYANTNGVPILNAGQWAAFTEARQEGKFANVTWNNTTAQLSFSLVATTTPGLAFTIMLPLVHSGSSLKTVTVDGAPTPYSVELVDGVNTGFISVASGSANIVATYEADTALTGVAAANSSPQVLLKTVAFTATVTGGSNPNFVWQFGDGEFGSGANTTHAFKTYPLGGTQVVTLTASNGAGSVVRTTTVTLLLPPQSYLPIVTKLK